MLETIFAICAALLLYNWLRGEDRNDDDVGSGKSSKITEEQIQSFINDASPEYWASMENNHILTSHEPIVIEDRTDITYTATKKKISFYSMPGKEFIFSMKKEDVIYIFVEDETSEGEENESANLKICWTCETGEPKNATFAYTGHESIKEAHRIKDALDAELER